MTVRAADRRTSRQLGYKIVDDAVSAHFVFDLGSATQENLDGVNVHVEPQRLVDELPPSAVADLGDDWTWRATLNMNGEDVDSCEAS